MYGLFWLFGWYLFLLGGLGVIVAGVYFHFDLLVFIGILLMIDGITGLALRIKLGKKEGNKIGWYVSILSFGLFFLLSPLFDFYMFHTPVFSSITFDTLMGLPFTLIGGIGLFFLIRKRLIMRVRIKNESLSGESKVQISPRTPIKNERINGESKVETFSREIDLKRVEGTILGYLQGNTGKAFTSKSLYNRREEMKASDISIDQVDQALDNLKTWGAINTEEKEDDIFYYA